MILAPWLEWTLFATFAAIAVGGAIGMTTTMSMFRSGVMLAASFLGAAGLYILLFADLLAFVQVMMYVGGMLVMILFMVLFSSDPGGAMMTGAMRLRGLERLFSRGIPPKEHAGEEHGGEMDMSMFTPAKRAAMAIAGVLTALLIALLVWRPAWPTIDQTPAPDAARQVGHRLMSDYMVAFEGAGLLILLGIFGAVMLARAGRHDATTRAAASEAGDPPAIDAEDVVPDVIDLEERGD